jgi:hypothetical protein
LRLGLRLVCGALAALLRAVATLSHDVRAVLNGAVAVADPSVRAHRATRVADGVAELRRVAQNRAEGVVRVLRAGLVRTGDVGLKDGCALGRIHGATALGVELVVGCSRIDWRVNDVRHRTADQG